MSVSLYRIIPANPLLPSQSASNNTFNYPNSVRGYITRACCLASHQYHQAPRSTFSTTRASSHNTRAKISRIGNPQLGQDRSGKSNAENGFDRCCSSPSLELAHSSSRKRPALVGGRSEPYLSVVDNAYGTWRYSVFGRTVSKDTSPVQITVHY